MKKAEKKLREKYNFVRLNIDGFEPYIFITNAPLDVIDEHAHTAFETGKDRVAIVQDLIWQDGYIIVPFDEVVTDFDF